MNNFIGTKWLNHRTKKVHKLLKMVPGTGATFMEFEDFEIETPLQIFNFRWYDEETDSWTIDQDYIIKKFEFEDDNYFFERIDNPNPSKEMINILRNNKIKRII